MSDSTWECSVCGRQITKAIAGRGRPPTKCTEDGGTGVLVGGKRKTAKRTSVKATSAPVRKRKSPPPPVEEEYEWDEEDEEEYEEDEYEDEETEDEDYDEEEEDEEDESEEDEDSESDQFGAVSQRLKQTTGFAASQKKANATAKYLAAHGWTGTRVKLPEQGRVELTATRDIEMLTAVWVNGELVQPMEYTMWATDSADPYGGNYDDLPFNPSETTDGEIVKSINGRPIEWYNALAQKTEVATVNNGSVRIQSIYDANGDSNPLDRQITFTSRESGTRTIYLKGLRRVGGSTRKQRSDKGTAKPARQAPAKRTTPVKRTGTRKVAPKRKARG